MQQAIGGFFELELSATGAFPHQEARPYRSARTAFAALLGATSPTRVWVPRYICDSMIAPLIAANVEYSWYDLTDKLDIPRNIDLAPGEAVLYVNYFGILDHNIDAILADFGPDNVILDYTQAFFSSPRACLATIYSARKFVGVPDGAFLYTSASIKPAADTAPADIAAPSHLVGRIVDGPECHYGTFADHEKAFADLSVTAMSALSTRILRSIDWVHTAKARSENFAALHVLLADTNALPIRIAPDCAPLCYPYLKADANITARIRETLASRRVYTPVLWKEVLGRSAEDSIESHLTKNLVPIPCDQRYGIDEMNYIVSLIKSQE